MSSTPSIDEQTTLRIEGIPLPLRPVRRLAERYSRTDDQGRPRRRTEVGALVIGTGALGMLLASLWMWWHDDSFPKAQTQAITFMTLTSIAVVGLFTAIVATIRRSMMEHMDAKLEELSATLHATKAATEETAGNMEGDTQSILALLRLVAFNVTDGRREGDEHRARIVELWAEALTKVEGSATFEVGALRAEVAALADEVRSLGQGSVQLLAGRVDDVDRWRETMAQDFALAQVLAIRARAGVPTPRGAVIPFPSRDMDNS